MLLAISEVEAFPIQWLVVVYEEARRPSPRPGAIGQFVCPSLEAVSI